MNRGYIKLFRKLFDNDIWNNGESFDKRSAWIDLLLLANHKDNFVFHGMNKVIVKRGQHKTSVPHLQARWGWGKDKVNSFLDLLQKEGMIYYEKSRGGLYRGLLITIVNYGVFQDFTGETRIQNRIQTRNQTSSQPDIKPAIEAAIKPAVNKKDKNDIKNDIKNENKNKKKPAAHFDSCGVIYEE